MKLWWFAWAALAAAWASPVVYGLVVWLSPDTAWRELGPDALVRFLAAYVTGNGAILAVLVAFTLWVSGSGLQAVQKGFDDAHHGAARLRRLSLRMRRDKGRLAPEFDKHLVTQALSATVMADEVDALVTPEWGGWSTTPQLESRLVEYVTAHDGLPEDLRSQELQDDAWSSHLLETRESIDAIVNGTYWQSLGAVGRRVGDKLFPLLAVWAAMLVLAVVTWIAIEVTADPVITNEYFVLIPWVYGLSLVSVVAAAAVRIRDWWSTTRKHQRAWRDTAAAAAARETPPPAT